MEYLLLNKKYEVVFKTKDVVNLHEHIDKLYIENLKEKYENKNLTYRELEEFACSYQRYLEFKAYCDYEYPERLRSYLDSLDLMLAY